MADSRVRLGLNQGWLHIERSNLSDLDRYTTETSLSFDGGWLEVRQYSWSRPMESVWATTERCYLLNLLLVGTSHGATARMKSHDTAAEPLGRLFLVPPGQTVRCSSLRGDVRSIRCALGAELVDELSGGAVTNGRFRLPPHDLLDLRGGEIEWLLRRMYREVRAPDFATLSMVEAMAKQLAGEIIRRLAPPRDTVRWQTGGLAPWRLRLIDGQLRSDLPMPSLGMLADLCDMTVRHLARTFRSATGQTLGKHIQAVMVERASAMLRDGAPVSDVAHRLGYATSSSFAAAFRRATGILPSALCGVRPPERAAPVRTSIN